MLVLVVLVVVNGDFKVVSSASHHPFIDSLQQFLLT